MHAPSCLVIRDACVLLVRSARNPPWIIRRYDMFGMQSCAPRYDMIGMQSCAPRRVLSYVMLASCLCGALERPPPPLRKIFQTNFITYVVAHRIEAMQCARAQCAPWALDACDNPCARTHHPSAVDTSTGTPAPRLDHGSPVQCCMSCIGCGLCACPG